MTQQKQLKQTGVSFDSQLLAITRDSGGIHGIGITMHLWSRSRGGYLGSVCLPFYSVQDPSPHLGWVFSSYLRQSLIGMPRSWPNLGSPSPACQRLVSLVILDSVKLTAKKNHNMQESDIPGVHSQGQVCVQVASNAVPVSSQNSPTLGGQLNKFLLVGVGT